MEEKHKEVVIWGNGGLLPPVEMSVRIVDPNVLTSDALGDRPTHRILFPSTHTPKPSCSAHTRTQTHLGVCPVSREVP